MDERCAERTVGGLVQRDGRDYARVTVRALIVELSEGDRLALIGQNGVGKSTLLKVIAGIYEPVAGKVMVNGRITPLLDTIPGFDAEDTGYENIITAGLLRGMTRTEIESKIPEIEQFSELSVPVAAGAYVFGENEDAPRLRHRNGR